MVILRGEIWWAELDFPSGSEPGYDRPVLVIQSDFFNRGKIPTIIVAAISTNLRLAAAPGNQFLRTADSGLPHDSVIVVSQLVSLNRSRFGRRVGRLSSPVMRQVEAGLQIVLDL